MKFYPPSLDEATIAPLSFTKTALQGAFIVDIERREARRGFFVRTFCAQDFIAQGLEVNNLQGISSLTNEPYLDISAPEDLVRAVCRFATQQSEIK